MQDARLNPSAELIDELVREPDESRELLLERNNPTAAPPGPGPIHGLFEEQVARTPDAVALVFESERLTYAELNTRANRVAHRLHRLGVRPEECVGILVERSPEMVIGLLAILKAGGAYVPLDPRMPRDRLLFMIDETRASIVLTHSALARQLPGFAGTLIRLDIAEDELAAESDNNFSLVASPDNLMGLLYTSGSTGKPKATMITGRGFLNLCLYYQRYYPFTSQSRALLMMNFSFDAAFKNIVVPLLAGGRLILANPGYYDAAVLLRAIDEHRATFINTTPSQMYPIIELAAARDYRSLSSLECLMVGGEAMILPKFRQWLDKTGHRCRLVNVYGPAECSDVVSLYEVPKGEIDTLQIVPAGRAIDTAALYVLDNDLNLLPDGVPSELCVSGELLSRGYWRRPDITAEKFIPNPFGAGDRMYRTGDTARWRADGLIEILGRMSEGQVKLRGIRVELGEIESALHSHPSLLEAIVVAHEDESKEKQLVAYLVPCEAHHAPPHDQLRDFLRQTLPEYMVPAYFVMLESLPMNRNGKVDRKALPPPPRGRPTLRNDGFASPRDVFEQRIALIWEEVLNVQPVGVFDNFFELGGYSLLAPQLFMRIERLVGRTLPLELLTQHPTIDKMAAWLRSEGYFSA
jgi:amino acid adenylation domain-containing protein